MVSVFFRSGAVFLIWAFVALPAFAQRDVQSIAAIVNDGIVSNYDVDMRLNLILSSTGAINNPEERRRMRRQILQNLVDETLQVQEAKEKEVDIDDKEIEQGVSALGQQNNLTRGQFEDFLLSIHSDIETIRQRVRAETYWSELMRNSVLSRMSVSDAEIEGVLDRMKANAGKPEYLVSEIFLIVPSPDQEADVRRTANRIVDQVRHGSSFPAIARQFSAAASAAVGGDVGWVPGGQYVAEVDKQLPKIPKGRVSDPIRTVGGYYIVAVRDRRKILTADPMQISLEMTQIAVPLMAGALPDAVEKLKSTIEATTSAIDSCEKIEPVAKTIAGASVTPLGNLKLGELPQNISNAVDELPVGKASKAVLSRDRIRIFVVCKRDQPKVEMPTFEDIENKLSQQRLSLASRRYLRDLRRDAIIDYK